MSAPPRRGGRRRGHEEEHENHERWLVTYADMITLLMVLFIVLFAMSQVDEKKFNELKAGLAAGFGKSPSLLDGSESLLEEPGTAPLGDIVPDQIQTDIPPEQQLVVKNAIQKHDQLRTERRAAEAEAELRRLLKLLDRIMTSLRAKGLDGDVRASVDERGLVLSLVSRHVVFEPNLPTLSPRGLQVMDAIAPVLRDIPDPIEVAGHTNQVKVKPKYFPTDWELSSARAVTVLRYLHEARGVSSERLSASAYGHERPLIDPAEPGAQRVNKRVDVIIRTALPEETRGLLATAAAQARQNPEGDTP